MCPGSAECVQKACPSRASREYAAYARSMPRPPRLQVPGGIYHLGTRGVRREKLFVNAGDYELFGSIFGRVVERFEWRCHTYCLMPNHYHLLVETPAPNVSAGMQRLNGIYAQWFNHLYGLSGHVFERRFFSRLVESSYDLLELARYVVLNPVRAGLCDDASGWRWSSYNALVGDSPPAPFLTTEWLLSQFGHELRRARENFRTFVREAPPRARRT
jgi:putative transposase